MTYTLTVNLHANKAFRTQKEAERYANKWLDRLAELDKPHTWDECDWDIKEETKGK